ncbi:hypothetical protein GCM10010399_30190 [Dactylosporangium fulvum]
MSVGDPDAHRLDVVVGRLARWCGSTGSGPVVQRIVETWRGWPAWHPAARLCNGSRGGVASSRALAPWIPGGVG